MATFRHVTGGVLLAAATAVLAAAPATADPQNGTVVTTVCDDGNTYTMVQQAGADWNAQLDTDSTSAFHLVWYQITYELTAPDGTVTVHGPFTVQKGGNDREHKGLLNCTFAFDIYPGDGSSRHIYGPAKGWLTPSS
jgi:hypothetical protein